VVFGVGHDFSATGTWFLVPCDHSFTGSWSLATDMTWQ